MYPANAILAVQNHMIPYRESYGWKRSRRNSNHHLCTGHQMFMLVDHAQTQVPIHRDNKFWQHEIAHLSVI